MGCRYCRSGLGEACQGPLGLDDVEVACDCDCHKCPDCGSAYCWKMGGPGGHDTCPVDEEEYDGAM
jgi:hypothetical protein